MNKDYQQIIVMLNYLSPAELVALMEQITLRLKSHLGEPIPVEDEPEDHSPRRYLPRLPQMIEWGLVVPLEDKLYIHNFPDKPALLLDASRVAYQGNTMSINDWAKRVTTWKAVNIYEWVVVERVDQTLDELRRAYINENDWE